HDEYYKFLAFFNNTRDEDTQDDYPKLRHFNDTLQQELEQLTEWIRQTAGDQKSKQAYTFLKTWQPAYNAWLCDSFVNGTIGDPPYAWFRNNAICRMKHVDLEKSENLIFRYSSGYSGGVW